MRRLGEQGLRLPEVSDYAPLIRPPELSTCHAEEHRDTLVILRSIATKNLSAGTEHRAGELSIESGVSQPAS